MKYRNTTFVVVLVVEAATTLGGLAYLFGQNVMPLFEPLGCLLVPGYFLSMALRLIDCAVATVGQRLIMLGVSLALNAIVAILLGQGLSAILRRGKVREVSGVAGASNPQPLRGTTRIKKKDKILAFLLPLYVLVSSGMAWILVGLSRQVVENYPSWRALNEEQALREVRLAEIVDQVPFLLLGFLAASLVLAALFFADHMRKRWVIASFVVLSMIAVVAGGYTCLVEEDRYYIMKSCPVHNIPLQTEFATIRYGYQLPRGTTNALLPEMYRAAMESTFPYGNSSWSGGCTVKTPLWARISYCPNCRAAEEKWHSENR